MNCASIWLSIERTASNNNNKNKELMIPLKKRYSIRYVPGSSELPKGWSGEWSIVSNPDNAGRTLDEVAKFDGPWYPKCWPTIDVDEMQSFSKLQTERMPYAQQLYKEKMKEIKPLLKQLELQQRQTLQSLHNNNHNNKKEL